MSGVVVVVDKEKDVLGHSPSPGDDDRQQFRELRVDAAQRRAWLGGRTIRLTPLEFRLLHELMRQQGRVQTRQRLLAEVWELSPSEATLQTVDTHVKRLRKKLGSAAAYIETVRGVGYRFSDVL